jgi:light-harvesting complex 1 beta chain
MADQKYNLTGLSDDEAEEFHSIFMPSMYGWFTLVVMAHVLTHLRFPWI